MKKTVIPLLVAGTIIVTGCQQNAPESGSSAPTTVAIKKEDAVAVVNGQYISKAALETLENEIAQRSHGQSFPKEKLIEELVQRELLIQDALKKQLDKSPEYLQQLESTKKALLTQTNLQNFLKSNPVTDADIKSEYDSKVAAETGTEYKARHILVKTDKEAKKIIAQLDKGADFSALANKHSLDAKESQNGGDLGWFVASQMVAPFSEAVSKLENGKYTKSPVQTQFGWHVILREESRAQVPPPLEAVKEQLTPYLQRQKVQKMIEDLRSQAKVEFLVPLTEEKPEASEAAKPAETGESAAPTEPSEAQAGAESAAGKPEGKAAKAEKDDKTTEAKPAKK
ncbi:MAG: peptidylprolyl isomerase [Gammaproteobacteria bacterium]